MTFRKWAIRTVLFAGGAFLSFVLLTFLAVQIQQRTLRWHAERLSADMHQIRLYQSTWADAQRLMYRWGAWGHYDGSCMAASCKYEIEMDSIANSNPHIPRHAWLDWLLRHDRFNLYQWFGGRGSAVLASFTVHDGTIWRESTAIGVSVPRRRIRTWDNNDFDWSLSVVAKSYQRLHRTPENWTPFIGDSEEELAQHPYYKVGRPGGCMILCQIAVAYYSTHAPPAEIERLTSYNFSCLTRFNPCSQIVDLLPAAEKWHLYDNPYESSPTVPIPPPRPESSASLPKPSPPIPCSNIPVWAQARDARYVLAVEALLTEVVKDQVNDHEYHHEIAKVRVVSSLKEPGPWLPGAVVNTDHLYWLNDVSPFSDAEHLVPGRRYIVFAVGNDRRDQLVTKDSPLRFERCGLQEDTPEIRRELEKGFAQNDTLNP
jgi:hypothetical protein